MFINSSSSLIILLFNILLLVFCINYSNCGRFKRAARLKRDTSPDQKCSQEDQSVLTTLSNDTNIITKHSFDNLSDARIAFTWAGANTDRIVLVSMNMNLMYGELRYHASSVLLSSNGGRTYENKTQEMLKLSTLSQLYLREDIGLMRDQYNSSHIVLIGYSFEGPPSFVAAAFSSQSMVWVTTDGALSWKHGQVPFVFEAEEFTFHPTNPSYVLARTTTDELILSTDGGVNWKSISQNVDNVHWVSRQGSSETSFLYLHYPSRVDKNNAISRGEGDCCHLYRTDDLGGNRNLLLKRVFNFVVHDNFTYASVTYKEKNTDRRLRVSIDFGDSWRTVQLPDIQTGQFYSVVEVDEGMAFIHVDEAGDTGFGNLYASGALGHLFSLSLPRHFYPNFLGLHDFTRVKSMRGVLIATQMYDAHEYPQKRQSMRTVISYNKGATWQPLPAPTNERTCDNRDSNIPCALQIYGQYSQYRGIAGQLPLSTESAPGLIIVHGHVDDALQEAQPNVYVSRDGGYSWLKALDGPHRIEITNHGNVIAAIPLSGNNTIKFSFDDGQCWHSYNFTNETDFHLTGLVTEPGNKALSVAIWGYSSQQTKWTSYVFDFKKLLGDRKCTESDLEKWEPHSSNSGCVLGVKHSLSRVKDDSMCYVEVEFDRHLNETNCICNEFDYECEFGYYRQNMSSDCVPNQDEARLLYLEMCSDSTLELIIGSAYRRLPGDRCDGGFQPPSDKDRKANAQKLCSELNEKKEEWVKSAPKTISADTSNNFRHDLGLVIGVVLTGFVLLLLTLMLFLYRTHIRRRAASFRRGFYRYSAVANEESDDAVERLLPSQRVESLGGEEVGLRVAGEGATDEAGGQDESGTAVSISPSSYSARASAPKRSWFGGRRANKGAAAAGGTANGRPGPSGEDAPTPSVAGGASRGDARDRLLDSDDEMPLPMGPGAPAVVSSADANSRLAFSLPPAPDVPAARANQAGTQATGMKLLRAGTSSSATNDVLVDGSDDDEPLQVK